LSTHFKKAHEIKEEDGFQTVLRAAGETETTQENIQDWLQLYEGDPGFQLLTESKIAVVIFFFIFFINTTYIIKFAFIFFLCFLSSRAIFCFINPDYRIIRATSPQLIQISEGLF
jgi:hypothetical protein